MARKSSSPETPTRSSLLPLPEVLAHAHGGELDRVLPAWTSGTAPPSLLITGIAGVGKKSIAYFLAQSLTCEAYTTAPCEACPSCKRALSGQWIDLVEIAPEPGESKVKVDQIRDLKAQAGFGGFASKYRIFLFPDAERLTAQASNALLKLLEEPPAGWCLWLTASDPSLLLPTVVSRCQLLRLRPISEDLLVDALSAKHDDMSKVRDAARFSQGSYRMALNWLTDEIVEARAHWSRFFSKPGASGVKLMEEAASSPEKAETAINIQLHEIHLRLTESRLSSEDRMFLVAQADVCARIQRQLSLPLNKKILLQELVSPWIARTSSRS
jgi:DNA polymerase III delta' subunit